MSYHYRVGTIVPFTQKYYKQLILAVAAVFMASFAMMSLLTQAASPSLKLEPYEFVGTEAECGLGNAGVDTVSSEWLGSDGAPAPALKLEKLGATTNCASAGARVLTDLINQDISKLTSLSFDYKDGGHCGGGAPRFNVRVAGNTYFLGCNGGVAVPSAVAGWTTVSFGATQFGTAGIPVTGNIDRISIVFDEGTDTPVGGTIGTAGTVLIDNVTVNDESVGEPQLAVTENEVNVYGNIGSENVKGSWLFNRDTTTSTPFEFVNSTGTIGNGSLHVLPINNKAADGIAVDNKDKFIAEYYAREALANFESLSYDFKIAGTGTSASANQFYVNFYVTLADNTDFRDCRFDYVPTTGSTSTFTTFTVNRTTVATAVGDKAGDGFTCPNTLAAMPDGSYIRAIAINIGDTSASDTGLEGYLDKVVFRTASNSTTFDLEPYQAVLGKEDCKNGGWALGLSYENQNAFKNQGDCVSYFATKQKNQPAGSTSTTTNARR